MTIYRPEDYSPAMVAKQRRHWAEITETTAGPRLVDPRTGEARPNPVHTVAVPSDASRPGHDWDIKVSWHPNVVKVWHHGQVDDHGQPIICLAYAVWGRCWHLLAAVLHIAAAWHDGQVPGAGAETSPSPRPRPVTALAGFYD